jgi:hypothetical protein
MRIPSPREHDFWSDVFLIVVWGVAKVILWFMK